MSPTPQPEAVSSDSRKSYELTAPWFIVFWADGKPSRVNEYETEEKVVAVAEKLRQGEPLVIEYDYGEPENVYPTQFFISRACSPVYSLPKTQYQKMSGAGLLVGKRN